MHVNTVQVEGWRVESGLRNDKMKVLRKYNDVEIKRILFLKQ